MTDNDLPAAESAGGVGLFDVARDQREVSQDPEVAVTGGGLVDASRTAMAQMSELTGTDAVSVSELTSTGDGWRLRVEVVELERIPHSTDILATYEVDADRGGNVMSYRRVRRYVRSEVGEL